MQQDAKPVGTGKLIHVAGPVWTVLELIGCICAVFLTITHKVQGNTAGVARVPGWTGELGGTAGTLTCR